MKGNAKPLLASLVFLSGCYLHRPDHSDPAGVPPPATNEITWESFFREPWPDPLHEKYAELFGRTYPNAGRQHFETERPFSDNKKYELAFENSAVPGARGGAAAGGAEPSVSLEIPDSAGKTVEVRADDANVRLAVVRPSPARRYRVYRSEELVVPLPPGADPSTARVFRDGDRVEIKFRSRK